MAPSLAHTNKEDYKIKNGDTMTTTKKSNLPVDENNFDADGYEINKKSYTEKLCHFYVKKPKLAFGLFFFCFCFFL